MLVAKAGESSLLALVWQSYSRRCVRRLVFYDADMAVDDEFEAWRTTDRLAALIPVGVEKRTGSHGFREKAKWFTGAQSL